MLNQLYKCIKTEGETKYLKCTAVSCDGFSSSAIISVYGHYYYYYNRFTALCPGLPGWAGTRRNTHPLTYPHHQPSFISFFHLLRFIASSHSIYVLDSLSAQPLSKSSLVYLLVCSPPPHIPYISSFRNTWTYHRNLFCCSTKSSPSLSLNSLLGPLSFTLTSHIHLTILISACWSAT